MGKISLLFLGAILLLGVFVRLYRFDNPIADWHSWRQADTSAVSWNFAHNGFDIFHPKYFDISNVQSGFDNPQGYRFVEFPLYNIAQAGLFTLFHTFTLEQWGRLVTIFSSIVGSLFLFLFVKRRANAHVAWFVLLFLLFLPYNIYYGRTILPDTSMIATMLGGLFFLDKWLDGFREKKKNIPNILYLFLALLCTAMSFLLKGYTLFYGLSFLTLIYSVMKFKLFKRWELWVFALVSMLPFILWRQYILSYPEGIPVSEWLFNANGIRFHPAFFRWIFYERLTKLIGGFGNAVYIPLGILGIWKLRKDILFFFSFVLSAAIYVFVIATGNVQHDYYQIVIMPAIAIMMGFGAVWLLQLLKNFLPVYISYSVVVLIILGGFWISWIQVRDYFNINNIAVVHAGEIVAKNTPKNAKIIAPYDGDTTLLYYTKRKGWPSFEHSLPELHKMGADFLVLVNPKPADYGIGKEYAIIVATKEYILFNLNKKP